MSFPRYAYHHKEPAKLVESQASLDALGDEWRSSPALCDGFMDVLEASGIDVTVQANIQVAAETSQRFSEILNAELQLFGMTKRECCEFADKYFDTEIKVKPKVRRSIYHGKIQMLIDSIKEAA